MRIFRGSRRPKIPWAARGPAFLQTSNPLAFIAIMTTIVGFAALFGISDPVSITSQMAYPFYRIWGGGLMLTGLLLSYGIFRRDLLIEKFSARILSIAMGTFAAWALIANGLGRSVVTISLVTVIVFLLEHRISLLNIILYSQELAKRYHIPPKNEGGGLR